MRKLVLTTAIASLSLGLAACDVEQTEEAELPEVEVDAEGGNLPEYDVDTADVDVEMEEETIEVPTLEVDEADAGEPGE